MPYTFGLGGRPAAPAGEREPVSGRWFPLTSGLGGGDQEPRPPKMRPVSCPTKAIRAARRPPRICCRMGPTRCPKSRPPVPPENPPRIRCKIGPTSWPKSRPPVPPASIPPIGDPVPVSCEPRPTCRRWPLHRAGFARTTFRALGSVISAPSASVARSPTASSTDYRERHFVIGQLVSPPPCMRWCRVAVQEQVSPDTPI